MDIAKLMSVEKEEMVSVVAEIKSLQDAFLASISRCGKMDKVIAWEADFEAAHFSRIKAGQLPLPAEKIPALCDITKTDLMLHWLAYQRGYELRVIPKTLEEKITELEKENEELKTALKVMKKVEVGNV